MEQNTEIGNKQVLILGGGIAGLSAAKALTEQGIPWELIEDQTRLGGSARYYIVERDGRTAIMRPAEITSAVVTIAKDVKEQ